MGKTLHEINLPHQLRDLLFLQPGQPDTLHSNRLPSVQVQRTINDAKLSTSDAVAQLLRQEQHFISDPH